MEAVLGRLDEVLRRLGDGAAAKSHYTVREVAQAVGRSEYRVRAWIKEKRVRAIKVNGIGPRSRWLIPAEELQKLLSTAPAAESPVLNPSSNRN